MLGFFYYIFNSKVIAKRMWLYYIKRPTFFFQWDESLYFIRIVENGGLLAAFGGTIFFYNVSSSLYWNFFPKYMSPSYLPVGLPTISFILLCTSCFSSQEVASGLAFWLLWPIEYGDCNAVMLCAFQVSPPETLCVRFCPLESLQLHKRVLSQTATWRETRWPRRKAS